MEGGTAFHRFHAVGDDVIHRDGGGEFDNGAVDALPMEGLLSVSTPASRRK